YVGLTAFVVVAFTAVGVDVAHLVLSASEIQNLADAAAPAAATALIQGSNATSAANTIAANNYILGSAATASNISSVQQGNYNGTSFTSGGAPANAVRVTATASVSNMWGTALGRGASTVTKQATAAYTTTGSTQPQLPIAIGNCSFNCGSNGCLPPPLTQVPAGSNNKGWRKLTFGSPRETGGEALFPTGGGFGGGGHGAPPC